MRAVGYLRVSTDEQSASGLGLDAQRAAIVAAAARAKLELVHVFADEGVSGSVAPLERPELARALEQLRRGELLLVAKRDRLGRDLVQVALLERELRRRGVRVVSAAGEGTENDDPSSLLQRRIVDVFAEHERDVIRSRTRAALRAKRARGERAGAVPFGFVALEGGRLVEDLDEQKALAFMREKRASGAGWKAIARALRASSFRPKRAKAWSPSSVRSILATDARHKGA
jgi:DNA invertase Pin-like site-specific DNA recombinase